MKDRNLFLMASILLSILLVSSSAFSQESLKSPISLYGGMSFPVNEFVASTGSDAGYAKTGYSLSVSHSIMVYEPIRLMTTAILSANTVDENAFRHSILGRIATGYGTGEQFKEQFVQQFENNTKILESGSYYSMFILTGPKIQTEALPDINVSGSVQIGLLVQSNPLYHLVYSGLDMTGAGFFYQPAATRSAFAFGLSGGVEVDMFKLSVKYISGQPKYNISRSYLLPERMTIGSTVINLPTSSSTGKMTLEKEPTSMIIVQLGIALLR